jgi:transposase-like protein
MLDFRLTARRDAKAAKAFLNKAIERVRLHRPVTIVTDKAHSYRRVIREINHRYDPHIDRKWRNNRPDKRPHLTNANRIRNVLLCRSHPHKTARVSVFSSLPFKNALRRVTLFFDQGRVGAQYLIDATNISIKGWTM